MIRLLLNACVSHTMYHISGKILMLTVGLCWFSLKCKQSPLAEIVSSVEAFSRGFISRVKEKKCWERVVFSLLNSYPVKPQNEEPLRCLCNRG